ncbi:amino acid transporter AVT6A-like [Vicia villosa]|uniref:amino acid transporter AVT6A-like n=1 Tax=Vicia villosa TaxID=3911 RepID=UPI00273C0981|nr:amino acid transporter AVT6A-like [Vicia villosa]
MIDSCNINRSNNMGKHNNPTGTSEVLIDESPLLQTTTDDKIEVEIPHDDRSKSNSNNNGSSSSSASFTGSVFNLSTTIIGAGIMALPAAMKVLGLTIGIVSIIFLALLTHTSLDILMRFSRVAKAQSYGDVMGFAFGSLGRLVFQMAVLLNNFGILVVYTIIIGDVLSGTSSSGIHHFGVLEGWFGEHWSTGRTFVLFVTTIVVFAPLGFFKRIDSLRYTSGLAVALAIVFLVITAGITIVKLFNGSIESPRLLPNITDMSSIWNLFTAAPVLVTAFVCHYNGDVLSGTSSSGIHHFGVLEGWFGEHWSTGRTFVLFVTTIVVFAPLGFFKRIDSLRYTSGLAVALAIVFLVITAGITIVKLFNGSIESPRLLPNITDMSSIWNLFTAAPVLVTAFVCHYNVHTIDNELGDSSPIQPVISASLVLCSTIYILTALFGFLLFGESTLDDVLANFDADLGIPYSHLLNDIVRISYALHLMLVFPVIFFSLRFNLDDLVFPSATSLESDNCRFSLITTGLVTLLYVAANFVPSIWDVFQFTGATATVCLGFIFPAAIALRDPHSIASKKDKILSIVMIILAVFSNVVAIYSNAEALFRKHQSNSNLDRHFAWPMKIQQ